MHEYIFLGIIHINETISMSYIELFYYYQNLYCDDLLPYYGRCRLGGAALASLPCLAAGGDGLAVGSTEAAVGC